MSLPISTSALVRGASRVASHVASRVGHAIGFDDVLRESSAGESVVPGEGDQDVAALTGQLIKEVRLRLSQVGIAANQPLQLSVRGDGELRVEGNHPRAAEIEALLSLEPGLVETAKKLYRARGESQTAIGLTIPSEPENILQATGGYPNW